MSVFTHTTANPATTIFSGQPPAGGVAETESPRETHLSSENSPARIMMVVCYMVFFAALNTTMFNVAIPDISRQFHLTPPEASWVLTAYVAIFGMGAVIYGKLADAYPIKNLLTIGLFLFNAGSLVGFMAHWFPMLIAGRMLQAMGGSAIPALGMLVSIRYIPVAIRGRVLAAVSSTIACGGAFGPIIGGFIAGNFHWRYLFIISLSTLLAIPFFHRLLPAEKCRKTTFDYLGGALLAGTAVSLLVLVTQSCIWGLPAGVLFLAGFVLRIHNTDTPFMLPSLMGDRRYRNGLLTLWLAPGTTIYGMMFTLPLLLRNLNHLGTQAIGMVIFPGALTAAVLSFASGRLSDRRGSVTVVRIGLCFMLVGYAVLSTLVGMEPHFITLGLIISYSGFSIVQSSLAKTVSLVLPRDQTGVGMGMYNLIFFMSGAFGAAIASRIIEHFARGPVANPFVAPAAGGYSNVFVLFIAMVAGAAVIFHRTFARGELAPDPVQEISMQ
jgi:DHA2 family metal-tetracycline-proton antiporter-like MFS transporter